MLKPCGLGSACREACVRNSYGKTHLGFLPHISGTPAHAHLEVCLCPASHLADPGLTWLPGLAWMSWTRVCWTRGCSQSFSALLAWGLWDQDFIRRLLTCLQPHRGLQPAYRGRSWPCFSDREASMLPIWVPTGLTPGQEESSASISQCCPLNCGP